VSDTVESAAPPAEAGAVADNQFVTFSVAGEQFAVPMAPVQEIIRVPEVARLPLAPPALEGLANLRGRVLPIVDLRRLFDAEPRAHDDATRALVVHIGQPLGFVVDRVSSVISVGPGELAPASQVQGVVGTDCLSGVIQRQGSDGAAQLLMVVDFERLVHDRLAGASTARRDGKAGSRSADTAAEAVAAAVTATDELRLVSFTVAAQEYAIDIADVLEIVQLPERITAVPNTPAHVLGLMSLRQRLLPLVSLRSLFGLPVQAVDEQHRIVVVAVPGGGAVGLVTDTVKEVLSVPRAQADEMPGVLARDRQLQEFERICRLEDGRRLVSVIATDRLLGLAALRDALATAHRAETETTDQERSMNRLESSGREAGSTTDDDLQVVVFRLGAEEFGVPIMTVQEIVRVPEVLTRVPRTPSFVEGVINLRGTVLPVIDQRARLGLPAIERNDRQRIMVYMLAGLRTGFIVDSVAEVLRIPRSQVAAAPQLSDEQSRLITQVAKLDGDKRLVMLIEPSQLLASHETRSMAALAGDGTAEIGPESQPLAA
jgi:purine-binding chemotaxis protein CheW